MRTAIIAYNPTAGRYPSRLLVERAASALEAQGWHTHLVKTLDGDHITRIARQAAQEGLDGFFVAGGDGSLNRAVCGLVGSETALGVLPAGTANVWAQELGLPGLSWTRWMALEESARRLAKAAVRKVDIGVCNQRPFLLWAGVGLDAFVVHRIEPRRRWEKHFAVMQYAASTIWQASIWQGMNLAVEVDGHQTSGHFLLGILSNIHLYAGGFAELSPYACLDDGVMDLWLFEGETLGDTVQCAWDLLAGRHIQSDRVHHFPCRHLVIKSDSKLYLQADGEPLQEDSPVEFEVKPQALRVLVPEVTRHPLFTTQAKN